MAAEFKSRKSFDSDVIENADAFYAAAFRGRGVYDRVRVHTLDEARSAAKSLYEDRPVMIYACKDSRQVHVENWAPHPLIYPY